MKQFIHLKNKSLTAFPKEILENEEVTNINLEGNKINEIPDWIKELRNLKVLYLSHNQITDFTNLCDLENLEVLHLNNNQISIVPENIGKLNKLKRLYLNFNNIKSIGSELQGLSMLKQLLLAHNQITSIHTKMDKLIKLEVLNLFDNFLNNLPKFSTKHQKLSYLQVSKNNLKRIDDFLSNLEKLQCFECFSNKISTIGTSFLGLDNLESINLANNHIKEINYLPKTIKRLAIYANPLYKIAQDIMHTFQKKSYQEGYIFLDEKQLKTLNLNPKDFNYGVLKILNLEKKQIAASDYKLIPTELSKQWELQRTRTI